MSYDPNEARDEKGQWTGSGDAPAPKIVVGRPPVVKVGTNMEAGRAVVKEAQQEADRTGKTHYAYRHDGEWRMSSEKPANATGTVFPVKPSIAARAKTWDGARVQALGITARGLEAGSKYTLKVGGIESEAPVIHFMNRVGRIVASFDAHTVRGWFSTGDGGHNGLRRS